MTLGILGLGAYLAKKDLADMGARLQSKWTKLHPDVKTRAIRVLEKAAVAFKDTPYSLHIFDGWRSVERQLEYIGKGTSFVNSALKSYHPWGLAVDFVFKDSSGNWTWEPAKDCAFYDFSCKSTDWYWNTLGEIVESEGFEWGGRWSSFDGPHAQLATFGRTSELLAKYETPNNFKQVA